MQETKNPLQPVISHGKLKPVMRPNKTIMKYASAVTDVRSTILTVPTKVGRAKHGLVVIIFCFLTFLQTSINVSKFEAI